MVGNEVPFWDKGRRNVWSLESSSIPPRSRFLRNMMLPMTIVVISTKDSKNKDSTIGGAFMMSAILVSLRLVGISIDKGRDSTFLSMCYRRVHFPKLLVVAQNQSRFPRPWH
mmetsp:Transcript_9979/g.20640  ORF Transcript_9979/g.20640 Transcript_9979/m.20640 type:complete len:112 (-) Transcript_9979:261-596(-)